MGGAMLAIEQPARAHKPTLLARLPQRQLSDGRGTPLLGGDVVDGDGVVPAPVWPFDPPWANRPPGQQLSPEAVPAEPGADPSSSQVYSQAQAQAPTDDRVEQERLRAQREAAQRAAERVCQAALCSPQKTLVTWRLLFYSFLPF